MEVQKKVISEHDAQVLSPVNLENGIMVVRKSLGSTIRWIYDPEDKILIINKELIHS